MKQMRIWLVVLLLSSGVQLMAQGCAGAPETWVIPGAVPTFLSLITGNHPHLSQHSWAKLAEKKPQGWPGTSGAALLMYAGKYSAAYQSLAGNVAATVADTTTSGASSERLGEVEVAATAALLAGKKAESIGMLAPTYARATGAQACRMRTTLLVARYLAKYETASPIFSHFNSGLYNYLQDSLGWKAGSPDANGYITALNVVATMVWITDAEYPTYLELLGDLLSKEPNRFNANYLSALAYLRAGLEAGGSPAFERKALFALEAPRQSEQRFNQYRFTQLKKALKEDVDSAAARQATWNTQDEQAIASGGDAFARLGGNGGTTPITTGFLESDRGRLPEILIRSKSQLESIAAEQRRYAGDVDLQKEVKSDTRFNAFALFLIGTIILSVIVIWRKLMKASRA